MRQQAPRDRAWLEGLFDGHHARLLAFATRRVGLSEAEDVVAEVFAVAWRRRADVPDPPLPWLYQAARNVILHSHRADRRRAALVESAGNVAATHAPSAEAASWALVSSVLDSLEPLDAEVLRLTVWEELGPGEIAAVLGISAGAARTRLSRARQRAQALYARTVTAPIA